MYCGAFSTNQRKSAFIFYRISFLLLSHSPTVQHQNLLHKYKDKNFIPHFIPLRGEHLCSHHNWLKTLLIIKTSRDLKLFIRNVSQSHKIQINCFITSSHKSDDLCICEYVFVNTSHTHVGWSTKVHKTNTSVQVEGKRKRFSHSLFLKFQRPEPTIVSTRLHLHHSKNHLYRSLTTLYSFFRPT